MKRRLIFFLVFLPLAATASVPENADHARNVIGILPLPEVFGKEPCEPFKGEEIAVFSSPEAVVPYGRIFVAKPWKFPPAGGGCEGLEVGVSFLTGSRRDEKLPALEFSYETPGAIVIGRQGQWFEIRLDKGSAWVRIQDDSRFRPVEELLTGSLTYLTPPVALHKGPGDPDITWSPGPEVGKLPVEVLSFRRIDGQLWVQVSFPAVEPCSQDHTHLPPVTGWLPYHNPDGMPSIWFFSRGC